MKAYTDYPFAFLGDACIESAPIREIKCLSYDGDKRVKIIVEGMETEIKSGYIYPVPARCGEVDSINTHKYKNQYGRYNSSKAAQITVSWIVYPADYNPSVRGPFYYRFLRDAWNKAKSLGAGSECVQSLRVRHRDGGGTWTSGDVVYEVVDSDKEFHFKR